MKKLLPVVLLFCLVATVWAAFTCTENFDSYGTTSDLNTLSGGTNWPTGWGGTAATWSIQTAPSGMSGNAARNTVSNSIMQRDFPLSTNGVICVKMQVSTTTLNDFIGYVLRSNGGDPEIYVQLATGGIVSVYDNAKSGGAGYVQIGTWSANTSVTVCSEWDTVAQPNKFRANVNGGAFSAWFTVEDGTLVNITTLILDASASGTRTFWVDDIQPGTSSSSVLPVFLTEFKRRRSQ